MSTINAQLLQWGSTQGHILTGGGILESRSRPGIDFQPHNLAHYHLKQRNTKQTIKKWLAQNNRSFSIVGAWSRPLFSGGWAESTTVDTEAFNLQTPSIFIDMRIPTLRPTAQLKKRSCIESCSDYELRVLARQHCFSGYSFPEPPNSHPNNTIVKTNAELSSEPLVITRHHIIDWNYHPLYPRSRPNRWWVQCKEYQNSDYQATESFKEFSTVRDVHNVPVYMERWARRKPTDYQHAKYLALRKNRTCPAILKERGLPSEKDAVFVLVGQHWCLTIDRDYTAIDQHSVELERVKMEKGYVSTQTSGGGGGPVYVDSLLCDGSDNSKEVGVGVEYAIRRKAAEEYVSLEGSYGVLRNSSVVGASNRTSTNNIANNSNTTTTSDTEFMIQRSTIPWLEGQPLPLHTVYLHYTSTGLLETVEFKDQRDINKTHLSGGPPGGDKMQSRLLGEWDVLECSYTESELCAVFNITDSANIVSRKLVSRL